MKRSEELQKLKTTEKYDIIVIGGGASGLGVALDAVSRGLKVLVAERSDFGKGTSSRSTKLIHGGVRYLAQGNVGLVFEALSERKYMIDHIKGISNEQSFIVPFYVWWMGFYYYTGLKMYDLMAGRKRLSGTRWISKHELIQRIPNIKSIGLRGGIEYSDGQFDDARLCFNLARKISELGGTVLNYCSVSKLHKEGGHIVSASLTDHVSNEIHQVLGKHFVNATGVFTNEIVHMDQADAKDLIVASRGSHIVLDQSFLQSKDAIMIPKTSDGRVLFIIPWLNKAIVGTTDVETDDIDLDPSATEEEINFILSNAQAYLKKPPTREDILATYAGLRPLAAPANDDASSKEISRGHKILESTSGLISLIGGKWTTFRKMGEDVVDFVIKNRQESWHASTSVNIDIEETNLHNGQGGNIHSSLPYTWAYLEESMENEMVETIEDVLARRSRCLFLDVEATKSVIDQVAGKLAEIKGYGEDWKQAQIKDFLKVSESYVSNPVQL